MPLRLLQKEQFKKSAEASSDLIGNKTGDKITKAAKGSSQSSSETVEGETENTKFERNTKRKIHISRKKQQVIDDLR